MIYCKATTDMSGKPQKVGCRVSGRKTSYEEFDDVRLRLDPFMRDLRSVYLNSKCGIWDNHSL